MAKKFRALLLGCIMLFGSIGAVAVTACAEQKPVENGEETAAISAYAKTFPAAREGTEPDLATLPETEEGTDPVPPTPDGGTDPVEPPTPDGGTDPVDPPLPDGGTDPVEPPAPDGGTDPVTPPAPDGGTDPITPPTPDGGTDPVTPSAPDGGTGTDGEIPQEPVPNVDTTLAGLNVACGDLVPAFSPDIYEYTVYVAAEQEIKSCHIEATPQDMAAQVSVTGPESFEKTDITRTVTVSSHSGETSYTVKVHVLGATELLLDGVFYTVSDTPDLSALPEKFTAGTIRIDDKDVSLVQSGDGQLLLAQFTSQIPGAGPLWYRYDAKAEKFFPVQIVEYENRKYVQIAEGKDMLYGSENGQGIYYVYDQITGEWLYQTGGYKGVPLQQEKKTAPLLWIGLIVVAVWALFATVMGCRIYQRYKKNEVKNAEQIYFRPRFKAVDEENIEASSEGKLK